MFLYRVNELSCLLYNGYITQLGRMWESFYKFPAPFHPSKTLLRRTCLNAAFLFFFPSFLLFFSFPPSLLPSHPPFLLPFTPFFPFLFPLWKNTKISCVQHNLCKKLWQFAQRSLVQQELLQKFRSAIPKKKGSLTVYG